MICVLHSGGIDSTAVIQYYLNLNKIVQPLFIDYGQISAKTEFKYSQKIANYFKINKPFFVNLRKFRDINPDHSLFSGKDRGNFHDSFKNQFFPNRNLLLLTIGSVYCKSNNINKIAIGIVGGGSNSMGYPDTNSKFLKSVDSLFSSTLDINVEGPIVSWTKKKVISFLNKNKFDFNLTFSCNVCSVHPCNKCASCIERNIALNNYLL